MSLQADLLVKLILNRNEARDVAAQLSAIPEKRRKFEERLLAFNETENEMLGVIGASYPALAEAIANPAAWGCTATLAELADQCARQLGYSPNNFDRVAPSLSDTLKMVGMAEPAHENRLLTPDQCLSEKAALAQSGKPASDCVRTMPAGTRLLVTGAVHVEAPGALTTVDSNAALDVFWRDGEMVVVPHGAKLPGKNEG